MNGRHNYARAVRPSRQDDEADRRRSERPIVYVIDDDPAMRDAIDTLARSVGLPVEAFGSTREFLERWQRGRPSCLVLDIRLPGRSGLDFQQQLMQSGIHIPIIFITGHGDIPMSVRAMKAGAIEFLTKPFRDQDLLDAIHVALEKDRERRERQQALDSLRRRFNRLTPREREVLPLVVSGRLNKQVAAQLGTSEVTVKVHRASIMRKMQAESLAELVRMAADLGISNSCSYTKA